MTRVVAAFFGAVLVLAACSSSSDKAATTSTTATVASTAPTTVPANPTTSDAWPVYHHDAARTGVADERTPIAQPHKLWDSAELDGDVYAQPLVVGDRVFVATEGNSVYALEAATGKQVWRAQLGPPVNGNSLPCGNINPSGITGTPAIEPATDTLFVVAFLAAGTKHELVAVDTGNGAVRWRRAIDPPGLSGRVEQERGALALSGGRVYVPYGGLAGDCGPYKGAIVSSPVDGQGALTSYVVPTTREAGIWHPGGPAIDSTGDLYVSTGNSESSGNFDYGNAVVRISPQLQAKDFFAPTDWLRLNRGDIDLGGMGPALVGDKRAFITGKNGIGYLLDRDRLGHIGGAITQVQACSGGAFGTAAVLGSVVFLPCSDGLFALRTDNDRLTQVWRRGAQAGPPIVAGGAVWVLTGTGQLNALDPASGRQLFSTQLDDPASRFVSMSAAGGRLFVAPRTKVTAFALR